MRFFLTNMLFFHIIETIVSNRRKGGVPYEDDFSAQEKAAVKSAWVQKKNEDRRRTESSGRETRQRKKEIKRLVYRAIC